LYPVKETLTLDARDSGSAKAPVIYRAYPGERPVLSGGRLITGFHVTTDPAVLDRLPEAARGKVWEADVRASGVTDFGEVAAAGRRIELFFEGRPMTLARWPNEGFVRIAALNGGKPLTSNGIEGDGVGRFTYVGDEPKRWTKEPEIWLHGYWFWDWADERQR